MSIRCPSRYWVMKVVGNGFEYDHQHLEGKFDLQFYQLEEIQVESASGGKTREEAGAGRRK